MARHFVAASSQYGHRSGVPISGAPLTLSMWIQTTLPVQSAYCGALCHASLTNWFTIAPATGGEAKVRAYCYDGTTVGSVVSTTLISAGSWFHLCGVFSTLSDRAIYLNGAKVAQTLTTTAPALDMVTLAAILVSGGPVAFWDGDLAEFAIWNTALSDADVAQLAAGVAANGVQLANLVAYYPLLGVASPEPDVMGGTGLTLVNGPTAATHPPITPASTGAGRMFQVF